MIELTWEDYPEKYDDVSILQNIKFAPAIDFEYLPCFKKVIPHDYAKIQKTVTKLEKSGVSSEQAMIEAFELIRKEA